MYKSIDLTFKLFVFLFLMTGSFFYAQVDQAPSISADGRQAFCIGSPINIVTDFTITDPDDTGIESFFIQISSGYQVNFDFLELTGSHPFIESSWNVTEGKLTLTSSFDGSEIPFTNLENAVKNIVFTTSSPDVAIEKTFSLSIGDANYLPSTDHFYEFISQSGITWTAAKIAAENRFYYGRQGYLATLTSQEEANFAGTQTSGAGWIGGSDEETEGEWKWVTGPEAGTVFWRGAVSGTTPNFAFWNSGEPNQNGNEDYAHITDDSIGTIGAWNDLPDQTTLPISDPYYPRGYIVEYGSPTDPPLNIVATTSIYLPQIIETTDATVCESESATISAIASEGEILWYENPNPGTQPELARGNTFTIDNVTETRIYYATITIDGCITLPRIAVTITVIPKPEITNTTNDLVCSGSATLQAQASSGQVHWYDTENSTTPIFIGDTFETPSLTETKSFFVAANNSSCDPSERVEVIAEVDNTIPQFDIFQNTFILCSDVGNVDLITTNPQGTYTYNWRKEGGLLAGSSAELNVTSSGNYSVSAVSEAGCESEPQNILVTNSEKATITIDDVIITDDSSNNSIQIGNPNIGNGNYVFAIDDEFGDYQPESYFGNLTTGIHTLFIKDLGGCGITPFVFSILAYPKFFTPNEDGINDFWNIEGFNTALYTSYDILIFNRFGKLIYRIDENSAGWEGSYQGKNLPSDTYWFKATLTDLNGLSFKKTGNFSLIRK